MAAMAIVTCAGPANAHEVIAGITGVWSQALHPFFAVETLLIMAGLACVLGAQRGGTTVGLGALAMAIGASAGIAVQSSLLIVPGLWRLPLLVALALGGLAAIHVPLGRLGAIAVSFVAGATLGLGLVPDGLGGGGRLEVWAGCSLAVAAVLGVVAVPAAVFPSRIVGLALRVAGSWIVAIATLGLALTLR